MSCFKYNFLNHELVIRVDEFAKRSETSVVVEYNDSIVLGTVCYKIPKTLNTDFLPLSVQISDNLFSKQRIPGSYNRRENKPSLSATLASRIIDRSMRPLFDKYFFGETQLIINPLGVKIINEPTFLSFLTAALVLAVSTLPFHYCVAGLKFAISKEEKLIINPTILEQSNALSKGFIAYSNGKFVMLDAEFNQIKKEKVMQILHDLEPTLKELENIIKDVKTKTNKKKLDYKSFSFSQTIKDLFAEKKDKLISVLKLKSTEEKNELISQELNDIEERALLNKTEEEKVNLKNEINLYKEDYFRILLTNFFEDYSLRFDGRQQYHLRPLQASVNTINESHGSGYFLRGETEVLSIIVLDSIEKRLHSDDIWHVLDYNNTFFLHYNFPAFSVGEVFRVGPPKRRELGHGALVEKAIRKILVEGNLNYTLRINCEVLSSNGSSSQASICAASLALYDAGIETLGHIAGIALGMLTRSNGEKIILTDIEGWEDHYGEMDFKVSSTRQGICTIQLDLKNDGISLSTIYDSLVQGEKANGEILTLLENTISQKRSNYKQSVIKCFSLNIPEGKTGSLIGPGGKNIKKLLSDYEGLQLSVSDNVVLIYHINESVIKQVESAIEALVGIVKYNIPVKAPIVRIEDYGIFVDINNTWALVHISQLPPNKKGNIKKNYSIGDLISVTPIKKDDKGRLQVKLN